MAETVFGGAVVAMLLGLLLGLERERSQRPDEGLFAGIRTFPLLSLAGYLGAVGGSRGLSLALPAVVAGVAALAVASYARSADDHSGATTEVSALTATLLGALVQWSGALTAASLAVLVTLLLTLKTTLHRIAGSVSEEEILSVLKLGIVAVVLVPLLPQHPLGPYQAIVPRHIGVVVLMLTGVSLAGYVLVRILGSRAGWGVAGALGGLVSSTAVTLSFSGKAREDASLARTLVVGVVAASTVLYLRGLVVIGLLDRPLAAHLAPRLVLLVLLGAALVFLSYRRLEGGAEQGLRLGNPVELGRAVGLALLFGAMLLGARAAQAELGTGGLWAVAVLGGLLDVDSVAVAAASLRKSEVATLEAAGGAYLVATLANLVVKAAIVVLVSGRPLARHALPSFGVLAAGTLALLAFWR
jgi:uncharacterized membrane protein (DUF4010 family)